MRCETFFIFCFFLLTFSFSSCQKEKIAFTYDHTPATYDVSSARLINLAQYSSLAQGNDTLVVPGKRSAYFPEGGSLPTVWDIPQGLIGKTGLSLWNGTDTLKLAAALNNDALDYVALLPFGESDPAMVELPRSTTGPSKGDHFKIRIVNLTHSVPELPQPATTGNPLEDLVGPVTLTYADGTPVSEKTTGVTVEQSASEYVEVPYGTYQFRVATADGRQISAITKQAGSNTISARLLEPGTSRIMVPQTATEVTGVTYAPVLTYQPGGVYTILVTPLPCEYPIPGRPVDYADAIQNQFYVLEDPVVDYNRQYGKVQAINGFPGISVEFRINGESLGSGVAFGTATEYRMFPAGTYTLEAIDADGEMIRTIEYPLEAGQNHSVWLWPSVDNVPQLLPVANDLSSEYYRDYMEDDGTNNRTALNMVTAVRFLNLCPDEPYISFATDNGEDIREYEQGRLMQGGSEANAEEAFFNLEPGKPVVDFPNTHWSLDYNIPFRLMVYRSTPGVIPGRWAVEIPAISSFYFVANPDMYIDVNRTVPTMEAGSYTAALIGRTGDDVPNSRKARIVIIKHSK